MKKTNQTGSIKRRIIAIVLSAITVASFCSATLVSASAATSDTTVSAAVNMNANKAMTHKYSNIDTEKTAYSVITSGLETVVLKIAETNFFAGIIVNGLFGGFKAIYEEDDSPSTQDILDTLQILSSQIEANHEKELTEINRGFLNQSIDGYLDSYRVLKGANKNVLAALSEIKDVDNCSVELCNKIMKMTNEYSDFNAAFAKMSSYLSPDGTTDKSLLDKYIEYMETKTTDPIAIKENAEQFANVVVGQYVLAYAMRLTGYSAEIKKTQIENKINPSDSEEVKEQKQKAIDDITNSNKGIVKSLTATDLKSAVDRMTKFKDSLNSIDSATVTVDGKEDHYYSIVDAWAAAVNSNGKATITLNKDINTDNFANITHITTGTSQYCKNGALWLDNSVSEITVDLNGHNLVNENGEAIIINNCKSFKVTSSSDNKGTLSGIKAEGDSSNKSTVELSNIEFNGGINTAVYADYSVNSLNINNCTFKNYTDSAVMLHNNNNSQRYANISNCVFENNSGSNGGAVDNDSFFAEINNCTFKNNKATGNGGAIYYDSHYYPIDDNHFVTVGKLELNNDNFESNSASDGGAVHINRENDYGKIDRCTFNNNNASSNGGAVCSERELKVNNSSFVKNHSSADGGAVCVKSDHFAKFICVDFYENSCDNDGGAIAVWSHTDADLLNCNIKNNSCGGNGGGVYLGALSNPSTQHQLNNVTITNNTCGKDGGGIYCNTQAFASGDVNLYNVITIKDNHKSNGADSNARMIYAAAKKALLYVRSSFNLEKSCIYLSSNSNNTAVVSLSSSRSESYSTQANPFHADGGRIARGKIYNGTIYYYN